MDRPTQLPGALNYDQWNELEAALFDRDAGAALESVKEYARSHGVPPVAMLIQVVQYILCCLPPGKVFFDIGLGPGSLNTFVVLLGVPGAGKDRLMRTVEQCVSVSVGTTELKPVVLHTGSGEGLINALMPTADNPAGVPVLFRESEVGKLHTQMGRQGSTLRPTLLDIYSGNSLGSTTKSGVVNVPAYSYTAGLCVAAQPDKAHLLLGGDDDGFRHRFIWVELLDPNRPRQRPQSNDGAIKVSIPPELLKGNRISFPQQVSNDIWEANYLLSAFGQAGENSGHRSYTRLKIAAGLALLRSTGRVSVDDWYRAGVILDYSDKVQAYANRYGDDKAVANDADRLERKERAVAEKERRVVKKRWQARVDVLEYVDSADDGEPPVNWGKLKQSKNGGDKRIWQAALDWAVKQEGVISRVTGTGATELERGYKFHELLDYARVQYAEVS